MALFGWYVLGGIVSMVGCGVYLLRNQKEGKLSDQERLSVAVGGMLLLLVWPFVLVSVLYSLRKKTPDE